MAQQQQSSQQQQQQQQIQSIPYPELYPQSIPLTPTLQQQQQQPYSHHQYIPQQPHSHTHHHHQPHPLNQQPPPHPFPYHQYHLPNPYAAYHHPVPPPPPSYHHHYAASSESRPSSKRPRDSSSGGGGGGDSSGGGGGEQPAAKRQALGSDVLFRVVVPSSQIGKVIGKGGHRVQKVRDSTKATVKIADPIARYEERVIIISSKANDGGVTDAETALLQIAALILADDGSSVQTLSVTAAAAAVPYGGAGAVTDVGSLGVAAGVNAGHVPANLVRLLIAGSQAGGLIGVSGQNIEKLRNSSGATIAVLAPNQLPLCASAHESDRLVEISGEVSAVLKAVEEIGSELRANPPNQVISITPTYNLSIARAAQPYMDPNAAEYVTLDMVISETMIGGLIGRSGSNIGRIRSESGAMIKVFGGKGEQKHRQIQLIGTAPQVALAKQRVDEYIYSQLTQ